MDITHITGATLTWPLDWREEASLFVLGTHLIHTITHTHTQGVNNPLVLSLPVSNPQQRLSPQCTLCETKALISLSSSVQVSQPRELKGYVKCKHS